MGLQLSSIERLSFWQKVNPSKTVLIDVVNALES